MPSVVGHLRPLVLIPASAISGLSAEQLEMILAHELAHVRRCDYLVNAVQTIIESLLFYHPCVWWVSAQVRAERENCCDDVAVSVCGDAEQYVRALFSLEKLSGHSPLPAVAANGGSLLGRIRRLLGCPVSTEPTMRRNAAWLGGLLVVLAMSTLGGELSYQVVYAARESVQNSEAPQQLPVTTTRLNELVPTRSERKVIAEVERVGGTYDLMPAENGQATVVAVYLGRTEADDSLLEQLASLENVHTLALNDTNITDDGLEYLRHKKELRWLEMENTDIQGPGLVHLTGLEHLLVLKLGRTLIDDRAIKHLMDMSALRKLGVERTDVTQAGVRALWVVRPDLRVLGVDRLDPGDPTQIELLLDGEEKTSSANKALPADENTRRLMAAMKARDDRVQSFSFQWTERRRDQPGILRSSGRLFTAAGPSNRDEIVHKSQTHLLVDGHKLYYEIDREQPMVDADGEVTYRHVIYRSSFDGRMERSWFEYPNSEQQNRGSLRPAGISSETNLAALDPLLWTFCTFDEAMAKIDWNRLKLLEESVEIEGASCLVLEQELEPTFIGSQRRPSRRWYVDPARDYSIVRYEHRTPDGKVTLQTDIAHQQNSAWGWVPSGWTIHRHDMSGNPTSTVAATVTRYEINPALPAETFQLTFPEDLSVDRN